MTNYANFEIQNPTTHRNQEQNLQLNTGILFSHESEYRRPNFFSKKVTEFLSNYYLGKKGVFKSW